MTNSLNIASQQPHRPWFEDFFTEIFGSSIYPAVPTPIVIDDVIEDSKGDLFDRRMPYSGNDVSSKLEIQSEN